MLDAQERSQLIVALEAWARSVPDKSLVGFLDGDKLFSPKEIVREVREETPDGQAVLEILEHGVLGHKGARRKRLVQRNALGGRRGCERPD